MNAPNLITFIRLIGFYVVVFCLTNGQQFITLAFVVFVLCAAFDKLDGILARKLNQSTDIGRFFDGSVDKIVIIGLPALFCALLPSFPVWLFIINISRDLLVEGMRQYSSYKGNFPKGNNFGKLRNVLILISIGTGILLLNDQLFNFKAFLWPAMNYLYSASTVIGIYSAYLYFKESAIKL